MTIPPVIIQRATTNLMPNPVAATDTTGWATTGSKTLARTSSLPAPLPDGLADTVTTGIQVTATANSGPFTAVANSPGATLTAAPHTMSVYLYIPSAWSGAPIYLQPSGFTGVTNAGGVFADMGIRDDWQRVGVPGLVPDAADLSGWMQIAVGSGTWISGETITFTAAQTEIGDHATAFTTGTRAAKRAPGYVTIGSPHIGPLRVGTKG